MLFSHMHSSIKSVNYRTTSFFKKGLVFLICTRYIITCPSQLSVLLINYFKKVIDTKSDTRYTKKVAKTSDGTL